MLWSKLCWTYCGTWPKVRWTPGRSHAKKREPNAAQSAHKPAGKNWNNSWKKPGEPV